MTPTHPTQPDPIMDHLPDEQLALMAERLVLRNDSTDVPEHIHRCGRCYAVFAEFARTLAEFRFDANARELPEELLAEARASSRPLEAEQARPSSPESPERSRRFWIRWTPALAVPLVAAALLWPTSEPGLDLSAAEIARAGQEAFALPGVELQGGEASPVLRATDVADESFYRQQRQRLLRRYETDPSTETAILLIGTSLHLDRVQDAVAFLESALVSDELSPRLLMLDGIIMFRHGENTDAIERLRLARSRAPDDPLIRFNLAKARYAAADPAGRDDLQWVVDRAPESTLAASAQRILGQKNQDRPVDGG